MHKLEPRLSEPAANALASPPHSSRLLENLYQNIRFWETEGEECIRTHPSFLARWNTKRKLLKGGAGGTGGAAGCCAIPGAQPVTSPTLKEVLASGAAGGAALGEGSPWPAKLGDREFAVGVRTESLSR